MSQEKVNRYKEEKANRKKNVAKEKRNKKISTFVGVLISLIIVGYLGVSLYATLTEDARQEAEYAITEARRKQRSSVERSVDDGWER